MPVFSVQREYGQIFMPTKKPLLHIKAKSGLKKQIKLKRKYLLSEFFKTAYYQIDKQKQHRRRGKHGVHHAYAYFMTEKVKFHGKRVRKALGELGGQYFAQFVKRAAH